MAISTVKAQINGQTYNLTLNSSTGKYESTITAPSKSSYKQSGGYYPVTITATDNAGNSSIADTSTSQIGDSLKLVVKEKTPPVISITAPTTGAYITNNKPDIKFTVTDDDLGVNGGSITINIDGTNYTSQITKTSITDGYSCTYTPESALDDGSHTIYVSATDNDGNTATSSFVSITVDTNHPELIVSTPADNLVTNQASVTVTGQTNDVTSSPVTLEINGTIVNVQSDGSFSHSVPLNVGTNTITVLATDAAGKSTTVTRTVLRDDSAPVINSVTVSPNPVIVGNTFTLSVNVTD